MWYLVAVKRDGSVERTTFGDSGEAHAWYEAALRDYNVTYAQYGHSDHTTYHGALANTEEN